MADEKTILISGEYVKLQSLSLAAAQTPYPGMLLKLDSAGALTVHATQGGYGEMIIALEDALQGKTIADAYTAGTLCDCAIPLPGSEFLALLSVDQNVIIGDQLCSEGNGKFEKIDTGDVPLCVVLEACDLTGSTAVDTLVKVRRI